jgi:hypothetical protein
MIGIWGDWIDAIQIGKDLHFGLKIGFGARNLSDTNLSRRVFSLPKETRRTFRREIPLAAPITPYPAGRFFRGTLSIPGLQDVQRPDCVAYELKLFAELCVV